MEYPTHEEYVAVFGEYEEDTGTATTEEQAVGGEPTTPTTTEEAAPVENAEGTPMDEVEQKAQKEVQSLPKPLPREKKE